MIANLNNTAFALLFAAKISGIIGMAFAYLGKSWVGGSLLLLDGILLIMVVILCLISIKNLNSINE